MLDRPEPGAGEGFRRVGNLLCYLSMESYRVRLGAERQMEGGLNETNRQ